MSDATLTPAPWLCERSLDPDFHDWWVLGSDNCIVACGLATAGCDPANEPDGLLCAAAPDLLEVVEAALRISDLWLPVDADAEHADEAKVLHMLYRDMLAAVELVRGETTIDGRPKASHSESSEAPDNG